MSIVRSVIVVCCLLAAPVAFADDPPGQTPASTAVVPVDTGINSPQMVETYSYELEQLETFVDVVVSAEADVNIPSDAELQSSLRKATQALLMTETGSVVFTGPPGAGKSFRLRLMLSYLAQMGPQELRDRLYLTVEPAAFAARGNGRAGETEEKVRKLIELSRKVPLTLLIDEVHALSGAGTHQGSSIDILEMLKDHLASGRIRIIGTTTDFEYESHIGARPSVSQRFVRLQVNEPAEHDLILILKDRYQKLTRRPLTDQVLEAILEISRTFGGTSAEPRRSLRLVDYIVGYEKLESKPVARRAKLIELASEFYSINLENFLDQAKNETLLTLAENASNDKVIGMKGAIGEIFKSVRLWMRKMDRSQPLSILIYGGRGKGKTFFSSSIAESLGYKFEKISLSGAITAEEIESRIATQLEIHPFTLFLVDELDKTDVRVQRAFLSVTDSPTLIRRKMLTTGQPGPVVSVSTKNAIFMFTTNAGESFATQALPSDAAKERLLQTDLLDKYLIDRMRKVVAFPGPDREALKTIILTKWRQTVKNLRSTPELANVSDEEVLEFILSRIEGRKQEQRGRLDGIGFGANEQKVSEESPSIRVVEQLLEDLAENVVTGTHRPLIGLCRDLFLLK